MNGKIMIVEDEAAIRELLRYNLQKEGYLVMEAADGNAAVQMARVEGPSLILLDIMIPGMDGLEVCRTLKNQNQTAAIPIIMITARDEEVDKIVGLELGADDYITKPFSPRELMARIKAVLRRMQREPLQEGELTLGALRFNFNRYEAYLDKQKLELTPKEFELLKLFATNVGKAFSREQLLDKVWGYEYYGDTRTVDVHVRHLRVKLAEHREVAEAIETVRGVGYRFREF